MYVSMSYKIAFSTECLITHLTAVRKLATISTLVSYRMALFTECLITHFT